MSPARSDWASWLADGKRSAHAEAGSQQFNWLFASLLFMTEVRGDVESAAKANGRISQNLDHTYSLPASAKAYLAALSYAGSFVGWIARTEPYRYVIVFRALWLLPLASTATA